MYDKILKNTVWLVSAQALAKIISFFYAIFLAKNLGVENFGLYTVALTYFAVISAFADFGVSRYIVLEAAKNSSKLAELLSGALVLRVITVTILYSIFFLIITLIDPSLERRTLSLIAMIAVFPQIIALTIDSIFIILEKLSYSAVALLILNISIWVLGVIFLSLGFSIKGAIFAIIIGQIIYMLVLFLFVLKNKLKIFQKIDFLVIKAIVLGSLPYGLLTVIGIVSFKMDTILLSYIKGNYEAGIYGASYRFLEATTFIPIALSIAISPVVTRLYLQDIKKLRKFYMNSLAVMFTAGVICFLGIYFLVPLLIYNFLPNYTDSLPVIRVLSLAVIFIFLHIPSSQVLLSSDKYLKRLLIIYSILFFANLFLYLIFIPMYGYTGAAWVTVFSEILTFLTFFSYLIFKVLKEI